MRNSVWLLLLVVLLTGCYYPQQPIVEGTPEEVADSLDFATRHHYAVDYNFILTADSLVLQEAMPMHLLIVPEQTDSSILYRDDPLVVAQIEIIPEDSIDSVWVKVARDQETQGWVHESDLLASVVPDDPISQFIHTFSNSHTMAFVAATFVALLAWLTRRMRRRRFSLVHVDDIPSPFPMLLCITLSASAVLYASIQKFIPQTWTEFYFHPTLNPFGLPLILTLFLLSVWLLFVLALATLDEIRRLLRPTEALLYGMGLIAVLGVLYIVFSISTLYYVGYPLLVLYAVAAVWQYCRRHRPRYMCGRCGARLHHRGVCPQCGAVNR